MNDVTTLQDIKLLNYKITSIEKKLDLVLEQFDLLLKTNARLRAGLPTIIKEAIKTALNERAYQGYSRISAG